jgi:hypothetical protein
MIMLMVLKYLFNLTEETTLEKIKKMAASINRKIFAVLICPQVFRISILV